MKNLNKIVFSFLVLSMVLFFHKQSSATLYDISINIDGSQEVPINPSTGIGSLDGTYDDVTRVLTFQMNFTGLTDPTTAAHFHGPAPQGFNAPVQIALAGFPTGVTSGFYQNTYVLTVEQDSQIVGGLWYVNIHTTGSPGGEIRGQLVEGSLPVELTSFSGNVNRNDVTLNWSTASELNNAGFDVERKLSSTNNWVKVGNVTGNGTSVGTREFTFSERVGTGSYNYRLKQIDFNGVYEYFNLSNEVIVGVPATFSISQNYPNPFNPTTNINYEIPTDAKVSVLLYDITGKLVSNLVNEIKSAGYYTIKLDGANLQSGTYFYIITAQSGNTNFTTTKKMTLIK
ncbi:MAG: CHRD domain-containing protein [bacterium]